MKQLGNTPTHSAPPRNIFEKVAALLPAIQHGDNDSENRALGLLTPFVNSLVHHQLLKGSIPVLDEDAYTSIAGQKILEVLRAPSSLDLSSAHLKNRMAKAVINGFYDLNRVTNGKTGSKTRLVTTEDDDFANRIEAPLPSRERLDDDQIEAITAALTGITRRRGVEIIREKMLHPDAGTREIAKSIGSTVTSVDTTMTYVRRALEKFPHARRRIESILSGERYIDSTAKEL